MKYILFCIAALLVCFGAGFLAARLLLKNKKTAPGKWKTVLFTILFGILALVILFCIYMNIYYPAGETAKLALQGNDSVTVQKIDSGYYFDGPDTSKAMVFYPGAKVQTEAYAPLMLKFAEEGIDCFLADMPFRFALLAPDTADKFINSYKYDTWILSGHSMGGIVITNYAKKHMESTDGILLLASYPSADIDDSIRLCSLYGSEDGCLNRDAYAQSQKYWPEDAKEVILEGGNHAQFADYGAQKGDGQATVSKEEQWAATAGIVTDFFQ